MKKATIAVMFASLAAFGSAHAESVFDVSFPQAPRFEAPVVLDRFAAPAGGIDASGESVPAIGVAAWSMLVPGLAQQKMGRPLRAKIYYGLETLTWIAAGGFYHAGRSRERSYKEFAVVFAGVTGTDRPDRYWERIGEYLSNDGPGGYNEAVRREARDLYYPELDAMNAYYEAHKYTGADGWRWRTSDDFYRYGHLRDDSRFAYRYALYSLFFAAALRVVSTADAVRLARTGDRGADETGAGTSLGFEPSPLGVALYLRRSF